MTNPGPSQEKYTAVRITYQDNILNCDIYPSAVENYKFAIIALNLITDIDTIDMVYFIKLGGNVEVYRSE